MTSLQDTTKREEAFQRLPREGTPAVRDTAAHCGRRGTAGGGGEKLGWQWGGAPSLTQTSQSLAPASTNLIPLACWKSRLSYEDGTSGPPTANLVLA